MLNTKTQHPMPSKGKVFFRLKGLAQQPAGFMLWALLALSSCSNSNAKPGINGKISGLKTAPDKIYLYSWKLDRFKAIDSAKVGADFSFSLSKVPKSKGLYKIGSKAGEQGADLLIGDEAEINIELKAKSGSLDGAELVAVKSDENQTWLSYQAIEKKRNDGMADLNKRFQEAQQKGVQGAELQKLAGELNANATSLEAGVKTETSALLSSAKGNLAKRIISMLNPADDISVDKFFSEADFKEDYLGTGNLMERKAIIYVSRFNEQNLEKVKEIMAQALAKAKENTEAKEALYLAFVRVLVDNQEFGSARKMTADWMKDYPKSERAKEVLAKLPEPAPEIGEMAPDIELADENGTVKKLSSLKGKIVLIDFWASWCGPCRRENPNVVNAYKKYSSKGFTIFSVSLDNNRANWLKAIKDDNLIWESHVSDLKGWQSAGAAKYKVTSIPATFLVDASGKIVAKNLRGEALVDKLDELLKK